MPNRKKVIPLCTTIHREQPFVYVLSSKFHTECCDFCFKKNSQLLKCSNCKYVHYCDRACQRRGWMVHKQECKNLKQIAPKILPDAARMLYRIIRLLENGGDMVKGYYGDSNYRTWRDLMSHQTELEKDKHRMEHMLSLYGVLTDFFREGSIPDFEEFMGLYGRICINSFNICNQELQSLGTAIYLGASIIDHSCQPNAVATFEGTTLLIRNLETLPDLDWSKIRISYIDVMASTETRRNELLSTYYFLCDCPKCLASEDKSEMFGSTCPNKTCDSAVKIWDEKAECKNCGTILSQEFVNEFKDVLDITERHLNSMKNIVDLEICKVCLTKHKGVLHKLNLRHVQLLDLAFERSIDSGDLDSALDYGLELIQSYQKYYPRIHPLTGLLHLKLCKLLLYKDETRKSIDHLRKASDILKITHGNTSSLYKAEVLPLIQQCTSF